VAAQAAAAAAAVVARENGHSSRHIADRQLTPTVPALAAI